MAASTANAIVRVTSPSYTGAAGGGAVFTEPPAADPPEGA